MNNIVSSYFNAFLLVCSVIFNMYALEQPRSLPWFSNNCYLNGLLQSLYATTFPQEIFQLADCFSKLGTLKQKEDEKHEDYEKRVEEHARSQALVQVLKVFFEKYENPKANMRLASNDLYKYLKQNNFIAHPDAFNDAVDVFEQIRDVLAVGWKECGLNNPFTIQGKMKLSNSNEETPAFPPYLNLSDEKRTGMDMRADYTITTMVSYRKEPTYTRTLSVIKSPAILTIISPVSLTTIGRIRSYTFPLEIFGRSYLPKGDHYKLSSIILYANTPPDYSACVRWGSTWWRCDSLSDIVAPISQGEIEEFAKNGFIEKGHKRFIPRFFFYERVAPETSKKLEAASDIQGALADLSQQLNAFASYVTTKLP